MKNRTGIITILLIAFLSVSCTSGKKLSEPGISVKSLADTVRVTQGTLVYALPRTVLTIRIEMDREMKIAGPYARYAEELLGIKDAILKSGEQWAITGVSIATHEEADPSEYYVIESGSLLNVNALMLKKEGIIMDLNPSLAAEGISFAGRKEINAGSFAVTDLGSDEYFVSQSDTAYRRMSVDSTFIRVPYIVEKKKKLTADQLAERAAKKLMDLRDGRFMILTGEANVFPQDEAAIKEINRLINDYTELFTGRTLIEKHAFTSQIIPDKESTGIPVKLFAFSVQSGISDASVNESTPVTISLTPEQKTKDLTIISKQQPAPSEQKSDKLYYRIPDVVKVEIMMGDQRLYTSRRLIYQFGEVMQLPANYILAK